MFTSGLGQLYDGQPYRALIVHVLTLAAGLSCLRLLFLPVRPWNIVLPLLIGLVMWLIVLWDAARCARRAPVSYQLKPYNRWYVYLLLILASVVEQDILKAVLRASFAEAFKVTAYSMLPTIDAGDTLFVDKRAYTEKTPQRGDLVAFRYPLDTSIIFVKRVIAVGGDTLRIENRKVLINGLPVLEPYAQLEQSAPLPLRDNFPPRPETLENHISSWGLDRSWVQEMGSLVLSDGLHVPAGRFFLMGDNRDNSLDSRYWGLVPREYILGKAKVVYFSYDGVTQRIRWERIGEILR